MLSTAAGAATSLSPELSEMATLQLGMMYQLLARSGNSFTGMRSTVYARDFTGAGPGQVKLVRVAQFPLPGIHDSSRLAQQDTLLLHTVSPGRCELSSL
jgi:hypothetical protein